MRADGIDSNNSDRQLEILPLLPNRVWRTYTGGLHLDQMSGNPAPADGHFPEDWIISTTSARNIGREEHASEGLSRTIIDGMEYYLKDLFESHYQELAGIDHYQARGASAGFLMKYLDSSVRLHLQCHPTISFAKQRLNANSGKTEGYMILGVRPDIKPYIYLGFQRPPEPGSLRRAIIAQDTDFILSCFDRIPVRVGDVFLVPGGLPHAIGEGIFMLEIMEPSDYVVRFEFECGGYVLPEPARFMGRDVDFALEMLDFSAYSPKEVLDKFFVVPRTVQRENGSCLQSLFDGRYTECFRVERLVVKGRIKVSHLCFCVIVVISGDGRLSAGNNEKTIRRGDRFLIPYCKPEFEFYSECGMELIIAMPPPK